MSIFTGIKRSCAGEETYFPQGIWTLRAKYLLLIVCYGNVPATDFCAYLSASCLEVLFVTNSRTFVQIAPWLLFQSSFEGCTSSINSLNIDEIGERRKSKKGLSW